MIETAPYILIADDNADDRSFIKDSFGYLQSGIQVKIVSGGKELLQRLQNAEDHHLPCLIVLDYNMPELNGAEVLQALSQTDRYRNIPKIILSTSALRVHIDYCMSLGATGYLVKPDDMFKWKELAHKMLRFIPSSKKP